MELGKLTNYAALFKDVKALWESMAVSDREKVDAILKKAVSTMLPPDVLERQKRFFLTSNDVLPMRLVGLALDSEVRELVKSRFASSSTGGNIPLATTADDGLAIVKCRQCGSLQELDLRKFIA